MNATSDQGPNPPRPIVVVSGLPRSGTSMMMQMLEAGGVPVLSDHQRKDDADNPRGYYELEAVKATQRDASWVKDAPGKAVKVIHHLLAYLPVDPGFSYRVIVMRRPIEQVLRSQSVMLERSGSKGAGLAGDALAKVFTAQMEKADALLTQRADVSHIEVAYPDVVADPLAQAKRVSSFLAGHVEDAALDPETMASAVDPSLFRQRA